MSYSEELKKKTNAELIDICKEKGIAFSNSKGRLNKSGLIEAILIAEESTEDVGYLGTNARKSATESKSALEEKEIESPAANVECEKEMAGTNNDRLAYLMNLEVGTIVAVKLTNGKVISAKVVKKSTPRKKLMVVTSYGQEHLVDWSEVVWVKTGKRWPKGVYKLFSAKGVESNEKEVSNR